jgi:pimeloyl-ACP methyl ester carboxylesterase
LGDIPLKYQNDTQGRKEFSATVDPNNSAMSQSILEKVQTSKIYFCPASENAVASYHLIYFITGNPGLISYYNTFLGTLHELLGTKFDGSSHQFHIYGQSLAGFEDNDTPAATAPYSLEDQINFSFRSLQSQAIPSGQRKDQPYDSVILIGHSVGSYILLEILQRLRNSASPPNVKAGILLFPTVTHIAQSPSGVKMSTLLRIPDFPRKASLVAKSLVWLAPRAALKWLVGLVTRMPHDAAEVTTAFLKSRMGVWQALHMAKDEMETITEDKWDEDIWGIEHEDPDRKTEIPRLIFYFGENVCGRLSLTSMRLETDKRTGPLGGRSYSGCFDSSKSTGEGTAINLKTCHAD